VEWPRGNGSLREGILSLWTQHGEHDKRPNVHWEVGGAKRKGDDFRRGSTIAVSFEETKYKVQGFA